MVSDEGCGPQRVPITISVRINDDFVLGLKESEHKDLLSPGASRDQLDSLQLRHL